MNNNFRSLFSASVGLLRTHHVFIDVGTFVSSCHEVPIKKYSEGYQLCSRETKRGALYWYQNQDSTTPEMPLKVLAKAAFFQSKGDWGHKSINPVFKDNLWTYLNDKVLSAEAYRRSDVSGCANSDYHLIDLIAQINLQVRQFDKFKKENEFTNDDDLTLKLLHMWYRVLQKQAVGHLISHNLDIKDPKVTSRINGIFSKL